MSQPVNKAELIKDTDKYDGYTVHTLLNGKQIHQSYPPGQEPLELRFPVPQKRDKTS